MKRSLRRSETMPLRSWRCSKLNIRPFLKRHNILLITAELRMRRKKTSSQKNPMLRLRERSTMTGTDFSHLTSRNSLKKRNTVTRDQLSWRIQLRVLKLLESLNLLWNLKSSLSSMSLLLQRDTSSSLWLQCNNLLNSLSISNRSRWFLLNSNSYQLSNQCKWLLLSNTTRPLLWFLKANTPHSPDQLRDRL